MRIRQVLLDDQQLVRAVASGKQRSVAPQWRRVELRYVDLKAGRRLQITTYDDTQAHIANYDAETAREAVDALLEEPYGNWHVEGREQALQMRVTKKGEALLHVKERAADAGETDPDAGPMGHDRKKPRLLPEDDAALIALGVSDEQGRIKPSKQAKYRQVEEFLRILAPAITEGVESGRLRTPTPDEPLRIVDLGCGNAYLTFAAYRYLAGVLDLPVHLTGVDVKAQSLAHNADIADRLDAADGMEFVQGTIATFEPTVRPDVVLALHACDTATDDALARGIEWEASLILAAPCCHHDVSAQLRRSPTPEPYGALTRHGILRERFADTLTDALRASALRVCGYRVDVVEFVESTHTPRNTLLRAVRTGAAPTDAAQTELTDLARAWGVRPRLVELLGDRLA
jgi:SAM-dependent methyltransferase